jgi:hypothetical protein
VRFLDHHGHWGILWPAFLFSHSFFSTINLCFLIFL